MSEVLGIEIRASSKEEILLAINQATPTHPVRLATINPEFILEARHNLQFKEALGKMTHMIIDGNGLYKFMKLAGLNPPVVYHGADLVADLLKISKYKLYLLGSSPGVAMAMAASLPEVNIVGAEDGGRIISDQVEVEAGLEHRLRETQPDILLVGFGAPKQELWIEKASLLPIPVMIGVGGTFNFYGNKKRAPFAWRRLGLEWLYRALSEPGHWKRVIRAVIVFPALALFWSINKRAGRK